MARPLLAQRRGSSDPHAPLRHLNALKPRAIYALIEIARCGRLYRFGAAYCLDMPCERGELHLVSSAAVNELESLELVTAVDKPIVPHSEGYVSATYEGEILSREYGSWEAVARLWNEFPVYAMQPARAGGRS
jgi:hypothetical protein